MIDLNARMSLKIEASRLLLSYLWWVLEPILFVLVFYLVFEIFLNSGRENFLLFLVCGKIPFIWFAKSITVASGSIVKNKGLISQLDVPNIIFPYTSVLEVLYKNSVTILFMLAFVLSQGINPKWVWFWLALIIFAQFLMIVLCSLICAFLVSFYDDFRNIVSLGITFLMFSSGIFWDINVISDPFMREMILVLNPLAFIIDCYRQILITGQFQSAQHALFLSVIFTCLIGILHFIYQRANKKMSARVLNS